MAMDMGSMGTATTTMSKSPMASQSFQKFSAKSESPSIVFNLFKSKLPATPLTTDIHSHLIPGIDDGVKDWDESIQIATHLSNVGYQKVITTPHVMADYYENTPDIICDGVTKLNLLLNEKKIALTVEAGAEYYLDAHLLKKIHAGEKLLTFGDKHLLIETSFMNKPVFFEDAFFQLQSNGYKPILAHPERYQFMQEDKSLLHKLHEKGIYFQINLMSLTGYYSHEARQLCAYLIAQKMVHFVGSDLHRSQQLKIIDDAINSKLYHKLRQLPLLNDTL